MKGEAGVIKGRRLEDAVEVMLDVLKREGHVLDEYHLLRARDYPDFWAKDKLGREYLIECKATYPAVLTKTEPKHGYDPKYSPRFVEELKWVKSHILDKAWNLTEYEIRPENGEKHGRIIRANCPLPVMISRSWLFDLPSLRALREKFQNRAIFYGSRDLEHESFAFVYERLRQLFTRKNHGNGSG